MIYLAVGRVHLFENYKIAINSELFKEKNLLS